MKKLIIMAMGLFVANSLFATTEDSVQPSQDTEVVAPVVDPEVAPTEEEIAAAAALAKAKLEAEAGLAEAKPEAEAVVAEANAEVPAAAEVPAE